MASRKACKHNNQQLYRTKEDTLRSLCYDCGQEVPLMQGIQIKDMAKLPEWKM